MYSPFRETDPAIVPLEPLCDCALHNSTIRGRSLSRTIGKLSRDLFNFGEEEEEEEEDEDK